MLPFPDEAVAVTPAGETFVEAERFWFCAEPAVFSFFSVAGCSDVVVLAAALLAGVAVCSAVAGGFCSGAGDVVSSSASANVPKLKARILIKDVISFMCFNW